MFKFGYLAPFQYEIEFPSKFDLDSLTRYFARFELLTIYENQFKRWLKLKSANKFHASRFLSVFTCAAFFTLPSFDSEMSLMNISLEVFLLHNLLFWVLTKSKYLP